MQITSNAQEYILCNSRSLLTILWTLNSVHFINVDSAGLALADNAIFTSLKRQFVVLVDLSSLSNRAARYWSVRCRGSSMVVTGCHWWRGLRYRRNIERHNSMFTDCQRWCSFEWFRWLWLFVSSLFTGLECCFSFTLASGRRWCRYARPCTDRHFAVSVPATATWLVLFLTSD